MIPFSKICLDHLKKIIEIPLQTFLWFYLFFNTFCSLLNIFCFCHISNHVKKEDTTNKKLFFGSFRVYSRLKGKKSSTWQNLKFLKTFLFRLNAILKTKFFYDKLVFNFTRIDIVNVYEYKIYIKVKTYRK